MSQSVITVIVRSSYTEAQKRASYKWNQTNQDRVKGYRKKYYDLVKTRSKPFHELCDMIVAINHPEFKPKRKYIRRV